MSSDKNEAIELSGLLTRDEVTDSFWRFQKATNLALPAIKCFIIFSFVGICAAVGVACKAVMMPGIFAIVGLILAVVILIATPILVTKLYLWSMRTGYYHDTIPFYREQVEYWISPEGIAVKGTEVDAVHQWSELKQVFETPTIYIVEIGFKNIKESLTNEKVLLVIPKRLCQDPQQISEVTKILRSGTQSYSLQMK